MKTSKIIFISLLGTITFLILAALIDIRINGRRGNEIQADFNVNKQRVASFKVLCVNNSRNITLVQSDSSFIEITFRKDSIAPKLNYTIKEDTLSVMDFEKLIHRNVSVRIYATDSLKKVSLKNSNINLAKFKAAKLLLELDKSSVWFEYYSKFQTSFHTLGIVAKNDSRFNTSNFSVDSLAINLQHSEANLQITARKISGTLSDHSKIFVRQPQEISLKKDETSRINVN